MEVFVEGDIKIDQSEKIAYIKYLRDKFPGRSFKKITIKIDEEGYANLEYEFDNMPFERIRRITGYLVGTLDRFNNAKRAEVEDREKHDTSEVNETTVEETN